MKTYMIAVTAFILMFASLGPSARASYEGASRQAVNLIITDQETTTEPLSAMGINVIMNGTAQDRIRLFGVRVRTSGTFNGPAYIRAAQADVGGTFNRSADIAAANAELSGTYNGDVTVQAANITITPGTVIKGNLEYSATAITGLDQAKVSGRVTQLKDGTTNSKEVRQWKQQARKSATIFLAGGWIVTLLSVLIIGFVVAKLFPAQSGLIVGTMRTDPWPSIGSGFLIFLLTPPLIMLLMITMLGIPVGFVLGLLYILALHAGPIFAGLMIGRVIVGRLRHEASADTIFVPLLTGLLILWIVQLIPIIGWLAWFVFLLYGLGGIWVTLLRYRRDEIPGEEPLNRDI